MAHPVSAFIAEYFFWVFLAILLLNVTQRRYRSEVVRKRSATLYLAILVFALYIAATGIIHFNLSELFVFPCCAAVIGVVIGFRGIFFPFAVRCKECRKLLDFNRIVYFDSNLCETCAAKVQEGQPHGA